MRSLKWTNLQPLRHLLLSLSFFASFFCAGQSVHASGTWHEHAVKLALLSHLIEQTESQIKSLVEIKRKTKDQKQLKELINSLAEQHRELTRLSKEYQSERQHVRFHHPERGETIERQYVRYRLRTLEEIERGSSLEGRLNHIKAKVLAVFPIPERDQDEAARKFRTFRKPASVEEDSPIEKIHLSK